MAQTVKSPPAMQETRLQFLDWEDSLQKGMVTHSSILTCRISWTEEPGGLHCPWGPKELDMGDFHFTLKILLTEVHSLFKLLLFLPDVFFLLRILSKILLRFLLAMTVSQTF